ncbi:hypothetical protein ACET3Z_005815 [Daucus carota]
MDGRKNWDWHKVVDISPFLRYEATGDSDQVNNDLNMDHAEGGNYEADDALSCCSDSYDNTIFNRSYNRDREEEGARRLKTKSMKKEECYATCHKKKSRKKEQDLWYNPDCRNCNDDGDDEDDGSINQVRRSCGNRGYVASSQQEKSGKSNALEGSSMEPKVENDKLFWDTCLDN